jgi:uncharacterized membrane protein
MKNMRTMMRNISSVGCQKTLQWAAYGSILAAALVVLWNPPAASAQTLTTYDATATDTGTFPSAINLGGTVAGVYDDGAGQHGFLRAPDGTITTFDPGLAPTPFCTTGSTSIVPSGAINSAGAVVGDCNGVTSGTQVVFLRDPLGNFTEITPPENNVHDGMGVFPTINDSGEIAGSYTDVTAKVHGFVVTPPYGPGNYTNFDLPGETFGLEVVSINNSGQVAGYYYTSSSFSTAYGFLMVSPGMFTTIPAPGSDQILEVTSMNDNAEITGFSLLNYSSPFHGFTWQSGTTTPFDVAGETSTEAEGINFSGTIVGNAYDASAGEGFVRNAAGTITTFVAEPTASYTQPQGVNALGTIAGIWLDSAFMRHGFIETPAPAAAVPNLISLLSNPSLGLRAGEVVALSDILHLALVSINAGQNDLATLELNGFIVAVQVLQRLHQISALTASTLITGAQATIALL